MSQKKNNAEPKIKEYHYTVIDLNKPEGKNEMWKFVSMHPMEFSIVPSQIYEDNKK